MTVIVPAYFRMALREHFHPARARKCAVAFCQAVTEAVDGVDRFSVPKHERTAFHVDSFLV